ncbi:P-loop containing nucleoside triphosphate hydrolase protein [Mycena amicta]|nr:P-loop containing nucleoside triphosphate hydrolase protein [Mycena amicta]
MHRFRGRQRKANDNPGVFNPDDGSKVRHTKIGVWDLYEEIEPKASFVPSSILPTLESYHSMKGSLPYVWRMLKEIASIPSCLWLLAGYLLITLILAVIPAIELWYSGLLLKIVQDAVERRSIDRNILFKVAGSRLGCSMAARFLSYGANRLHRPLNERIRQYYSVQSFSARARLDVPTYSDASVLRQLDQSQTSSRTSLAWNSVVETLRVFSTVVELVSQFSVLITMLHDQRDGVLLATLNFAQVLFQRQTRTRTWGGPPGVWAATTRDTDYLRTMGMAKLVHQQLHRQEIVAGGLGEYLISSYRQTAQRLGEHATDFYSAFQIVNITNRFKWSTFISDPLAELPRVVFTLRAVQYPSDIPLSLASLNLITQTTSRFSRTLFALLQETGSVADNLGNVRKLYETYTIPNQIQDGPTPFPEDQRSLDMGMSVEFRHVYFRYPGGTQDVLRDVSFKIHQGQLCVIVGANGSGKSTILKLCLRLFEPLAGEILINDRDIRTLKLADLRRATSVLFQDYTHFPLSIKDNIALGNPAAFAALSSPGQQHENIERRIQEAARLGGADAFIERLDEKYESFLERPVEDMYSALPQGTKTLFGRSVEYHGLRSAGNMNTHAMGLSGGQMQRIALSRTFMRDDGVGLLCFDEPSASLDPTAEHDLFERLRLLRGNKTMIFSSHRFGNLTRHADLILYMNDGSIMEEGNHNELIKKDGGYAKIWMLQAQAFLP